MVPLDDSPGETMAGMGVRLKRWTRAEYDAMVAAGLLHEDDRVQLVEGEIVEMPPQGPPHVTSVAAVAEALRGAFGPGYFVRNMFPLALDPHSEPEPDIAVVPGSQHRDYRDHHPTTALLVVEVADTTLSFDRRRKARVYAGACIPEYWIIDLQGQTVEVLREPDPSAPGGPAYRTHARVDTGSSVAPLARPDQPIRVADLMP